jgi:hypothetical protein
MIRFLADADLNKAIVAGCSRREPTIDFLSANEANLRGVPDPEVLALAAEQNRILVTHDLQTMPAALGRLPSGPRFKPGRAFGTAIPARWRGNRRTPAALGRFGG